MEEFEQTNINIKWLENIYEQLRILQDLERTAREGCKNMLEYFQIPLHMQNIILPEAKYKNMKFFALELDILIKNLIPILEGDIDKYKKRLKFIINHVDNRKLFLKNSKSNNLEYVETLSFLDNTINLLVEIKGDIIKDIAPILYVKKDDNKKPW